MVVQLQSAVEDQESTLWAETGGVPYQYHFSRPQRAGDIGEITTLEYG